MLSAARIHRVASRGHRARPEPRCRFSSPHERHHAYRCLRLLPPVLTFCGLWGVLGGYSFLERVFIMLAVALKGPSGRGEECRRAGHARTMVMLRACHCACCDPHQPRLQAWEARGSRCGVWRRVFCGRSNYARVTTCIVVCENERTSGCETVLKLHLGAVSGCFVVSFGMNSAPRARNQVATSRDRPLQSAE